MAGEFIPLAAQVSEEDRPAVVPGFQPLAAQQPRGIDTLKALQPSGIKQDQAVSNRRMSEELGLPLQAVEADPDSARSVLDLRKSESILADAPITNAFVTNPAKAKEVKDNLEELALTENLAYGSRIETPEQRKSRIEAIRRGQAAKLENIVAGTGERFFSLVGSLTRLAGTIGDTAADFLDRHIVSGNIEYDFTGDTPSLRWVPATEERLAKESPLLPYARDFESVKLGYKPGATWEDFKDAPLSNFVPFALEQGIVSLPDMAAVMTNLPAYVAARTGEIGQTRAQNDQSISPMDVLREQVTGEKGTKAPVDATVGDFIAAAPFALASAMLERLGTKGILGIGDDALKGLGPRAVLAATAKGGTKEAVTEGLQEGVESLGETLGTGRGFDLNQTLERMAAGAVAGVGFGVAVRGTTASLESFAEARFQKRLTDSMNEVMADSDLKKKAPETLADHTAAVMEDRGVTEVTAQASDVVEYGRTLDNPKKFYDDLEITQQLNEALKIPEGSVRIKMKAFAQYVLGTDHYAGMADIVRFAADGISPREAMEVAKAAEGKRLEEIAVADETARQGRIREIDRSLSNLENEIDAVQTRIEQRTTGEGPFAPSTEAVNPEFGKPTFRLKQKLNSLLNEHDKLLGEQATLAAAQAEPAAAATVTTTAGEVQKLGRRITREAIRSFRTGFREGVRAAKGDVKTAQEAAVSIVENSGLSQADKAKFIRTIKNITTPEQLDRQFPVIQARIATLLEKGRVKQLTSDIRKVLKRTKTKRRSGKPIGRLTPAISNTLDRLREAAAKSPEDAADLLGSRLGALDGVPSPEEKLVNQMLAMAAGEDINSAKLEDMLEELNAMVSEGRAIGKIREFARINEENQLRTEVLDLIGEERTTQRGALSRAAEAIETKGFLGFSGAWWNKLGRIFSSPDAARVQAATDKLSLFEESRTQERNRIATVARFEQLASEAVGVSSWRKLLKRLQRDNTERVNVGDFTHSDGKQRNITMTRAEIRKRVMELMSPDVEQLLRDPESNAYTDEIIGALRDTLSEEDHRLIEAQVQFYNEFYERINAAYENAYGVSLPKIENYSPIRPEVAGEETTEFLAAVLYRGSTAPGSLKSRTPHKRKLLARSDIDVLQSHIMEMEYFIAFHDKVRLLNAVFGGDNAAVMHRIRTNYGDGFVKTIQRDLEYFSKKGVKASVTGEQLAVTLMRNFSFAQLGAKPQIGLKQLASFTAFAEEVKTTDFVSGLLKFGANPKAAFRLLNKSDFFRNRGINLDQDFRDMTSDQFGGKFLNFMGRRPTLTKIIMLPIRYGDKGAIAIGGYAHIQAAMKAGMTEEQAIRSFERLATRTQQSADPDQISELQRSSAFIRVMAQFMSSANALTRAEYSAIVEGARGRITTGELAKRLLIYHFIIPNTIQFIANAFTWDKEDQLRASIMGAFNGVFILGDLAEAALNAAFGEDNLSMETRHPLAFFEDLLTAAKTFNEEDLSWEEFLDGNRAIDKAARGTSGLMGLPIATLLNQLRGFGKIAEGDVEEGLALMLGYSPYVIEKQDIGGGF